MNNFVFYSPTEFVFGKDTEMQVGALAGKYGARKVMIVYGGGSVLRSEVCWTSEAIFAESRYSLLRDGWCAT